ncbi:class I SAM-dependent methyltransferase [Kineococcus sp. NPDC059986]|uniref:class I SAM-dependent methyltransferase n=1 Tax=Kineococcus sp. NPDC059986 TaxID=3155538 RepID=UPI0034510297
MDGPTDAVQDYYASYHERELARLLSAEGRLEFALTTRLLAPHLPTAGRVLDLGGGPGRYSAWLAERGLEVSLADLSPNLLDLAREHLAERGVQVGEVVQADARDLTRWSAASFDAVLALGPFYHLPDPVDRHRALAEVVRVTVPGGLVATAWMPRWALLRRTLSIEDERDQLADPSFVDAVLERGAYVNPHRGRFTHAHAVDPARLPDELAASGLRTLALASTDGFAHGLQDTVDGVRTTDPVRYEQLLDLLVRTAGDPSLLGTAGHLLHLGRTT